MWKKSNRLVPVTSSLCVIIIFYLPDVVASFMPSCSRQLKKHQAGKHKQSYTDRNNPRFDITVSSLHDLNLLEGVNFFSNHHDYKRNLLLRLSARPSLTMKQYNYQPRRPNEHFTVDGRSRSGESHIISSNSNSYQATSTIRTYDDLLNVTFNSMEEVYMLRQQLNEVTNELNTLKQNSLPGLVVNRLSQTLLSSDPNDEIKSVQKVLRRAQEQLVKNKQYIGELKNSFKVNEDKLNHKNEQDRSELIQLYETKVKERDHRIAQLQIQMDAELSKPHYLENMQLHQQLLDMEHKLSFKRKQMKQRYDNIRTELTASIESEKRNHRREVSLLHKKYQTIIETTNMKYNETKQLVANYEIELDNMKNVLRMQQEREEYYMNQLHEKDNDIQSLQERLIATVSSLATVPSSDDASSQEEVKEDHVVVPLEVETAPTSMHHHNEERRNRTSLLKRMISKVGNRFRKLQ